MVRAFSDEDLDDAAALLARRHERHRGAEPLLPAQIDFRAEVEAVWRTDGASGAVADGAFVLGAPRAGEAWGANVWIEAAGHAADDPEALRDAYRVAAAEWVARGLKAHYVLVP